MAQEGSVTERRDEARYGNPAYDERDDREQREHDLYEQARRSPEDERQ